MEKNRDILIFQPILTLDSLAQIAGFNCILFGNMKCQKVYNIVLFLTNHAGLDSINNMIYIL